MMRARCAASILKLTPSIKEGNVIENNQSQRENRNAARALAAFLARNPSSRTLYERIRTTVSPVRPSQYDVSRTCNLQCEGCLFFAGDDYLAHETTTDPQQIDQFFAGEARRGVNFAQFAGAEPALVQDTLRIAARHVPRGVVFTNGTVRIADDIPYRMHISLWGLAEQSKALRGADVVDKAVKNYAGDKRAIFVFAINGINVDTIPDVAEFCAGAGVPLTFNHFTTTTTYETWIAQEKTDSLYFRLGDKGTDMALTPAALARSKQLITDAMDAFPDTVVYSQAFNELIHDPEGLYEIDPQTGLARDCGSRVTAHYRHFHSDLTDAGDVKCCAPNLSCATCRAYMQSLSTVLHRIPQFAAREDGLASWVELWDFWCRLNIVDWDRASA